MCEDGYINDYGKLETSGGRHPNLYGLNPESGYFIGVDIKRFAVNIGLINFKGDMVELKMNIPYKFENSIEGMNELCKLILNFIKKLPINKEKILNINVNVSGRVNPESGYSFSQFNFEERPLADVLSEKLGHKVTIDNDTRAMTYGEYMQGCVKGEKDIIFVNVSWGVGIGIIIDGKVYTGKSGFSGEFGHVNAYDNEIICHCGKKGCLETEASGSALHRILLERIKSGESSILSTRISGEEDPITLDEIITAVNKEDLLCIEIVEEIGQKLGKQIAGLINIFNPELVIIGGTLSLTGDYAGLLHDVMEDCDVSREEMVKEFGEEVTTLVEGVTKISKMPFKDEADVYAENHRKIYIAMAKDIRVILIKFADRLHNMRTLQFMPPEKQKRISRETLEV